MHPAREDLLRLADRVLAANKSVADVGELLKQCVLLHEDEAHADRKAQEAQLKAQRRSSVQAAIEQKKKDHDEKKAKEEAAKEAAKAAKEAELALERAKANAEAKQRAEEKALKEAEQAAAAANEAKQRAEELAAEAKTAVEVAEIEANAVQSDEQAVLAEAAKTHAQKAQREAERAEERKRKLEEKALRAAEKHAERAREKAGAALDVALAAAARVKNMGGELPAVGQQRLGGGGTEGATGAIGMGGGGGGGASSIASHRLRRASSRMRRLSAGVMADGDESDEDGERDKDGVFYGDGSQLGTSAADALQAEHMLALQLAREEEARSLAEEEAARAQAAWEVGDGGVDAWRGGALRGAAMPGHRTSSVAPSDVPRLPCFATSPYCFLWFTLFDHTPFPSVPFAQSRSNPIASPSMPTASSCAASAATESTTVLP
jgi:chemotaxis protein histidine kinase CheA